MSVPPNPPQPPLIPTTDGTKQKTQVKCNKSVSITQYFEAKNNNGERKRSLSAKIGLVDRSDARVIRIVHISDTHGKHSEYIRDIPAGDMLIHSGDFTNHHYAKQHKGMLDEQIFQREIKDMNDFFHAMPHKHKIFVAGNHETHISKFPKEKIELALTEAVYLQDSAVIA